MWRKNVRDDTYSKCVSRLTFEGGQHRRRPFHRMHKSTVRSPQLHVLQGSGLHTRHVMVYIKGTILEK
jgi:hypothetical protein